MRQLDDIKERTKPGNFCLDIKNARWLITRVERLEAALKVAKLPGGHRPIEFSFGHEQGSRRAPCPAERGEECRCGGSTHNIAIDAVLNEDA